MGSWMQASHSLGQTACLLSRAFPAMLLLQTLLCAFVKLFKIYRCAPRWEAASRTNAEGWSDFSPSFSFYPCVPLSAALGEAHFIQTKSFRKKIKNKECLPCVAEVNGVLHMVWRGRNKWNFQLWQQKVKITKFVFKIFKASLHLGG